MTHTHKLLLPALASLAVLATVGPLPAQSPAIVVEASYPGANAAIIGDTVAAPIEQQVQGITKARYLRSRSTNEGTYTLIVVFEPGTDRKEARKIVQGRVDLALPILPVAVKQATIQVKEESSPIQMIARVTSPDMSRDAVFLGHFADIVIKPELARVEGVSSVHLVGMQSPSVRVRLDLERLASRELTAADVVNVLSDHQPQALPFAAGQQPKKEFEVTLDRLGRLADLKQIEDVVLKVDRKGHVVHLKDVARVELGAGPPESDALVDGARAVLLCISPSRQAGPRQLRDEVRRRLEQLRKRLPPGVDLGVACDFTSNLEAGGTPSQDYLLIDLTLPTEASRERMLQRLIRFGTTLQGSNGLRRVLAFSDNPFDEFGGGPCLLVSFDGGEQADAVRRQLKTAIRRAQNDMGDTVARLRAPSWKRRADPWGYPIEFAVHGPEGPTARKFAEKLEEKLAGSVKLTDVAMDPAARSQRQLQLDIDRVKAGAMAVPVNSIFDTLQTFFGASVRDFRGAAGRQIIVMVPSAGRVRAQDLKQLKVLNSQGQMVPIGEVVAVHDEIEGAIAVDRLDTQPMVAITANPARGVSLEEACRLCERQAEQLRRDLRLAADYRVSRLRR